MFITLSIHCLTSITLGNVIDVMQCDKKAEKIRRRLYCWQEAQLSQRHRATVRVMYDNSRQLIQDDSG